MTRSLRPAAALLLGLTLLAAPARADDGQPRQLTLEGRSGVWLPEEVFRAITLDARRGRLLPELLELDHQLLAESRALLELAERRATVAESAVTRAQKALEELSAQLATERARASHWSRSPVLWLSLGAAAAAMVFAGTL